MFGGLLSLVNEFLCGDCKLSEEEVIKRIGDCYAEGSITGTQYDHLIDLLG